MTSGFAEFERRMRQADLSEAAIRAFQHNYETLLAGQTGLIPECEIEPVKDLSRFESLQSQTTPDSALLARAIIIKLNGGLGTSMGLERAKTLLPVKDALTFLDFIARQILHLRQTHGMELKFLLMNSFSTSHDTREFLKKYPELIDGDQFELMQSQVPKVDAGTMKPVSWPENPQLERCPPGHGDLYPSLLGSGWLDRLLQAGVNYAFVSNSDNLGATLDLTLLTWFAQSQTPFLMEVAERTPSDRKGGHLARRGGRFLLRESAQCPEPDMASFQNIERHRFFNTNSLWIRLDRLKELLESRGGFIPLPLIKNMKTVDPRNKNSPAVIQLESAMGAAIESFENSQAIVVPRSRFAPVKTTSDLLALRSDAYGVTDDWRLVLAPETGGQPPTIDLDSSHYRLVDQLDEKTAAGVPSLKHCHQLIVRGAVRFNARNIFYGSVRIENLQSATSDLPAGDYKDCTFMAGTRNVS